MAQGEELRGGGLSWSAAWSHGEHRASVASQTWSYFKARGLAFCAPVSFRHRLWAAPRAWGWNLTGEATPVQLQPIFQRGAWL